MPVEITVPPLGESITEAVIGKWNKKVGDSVSAEDSLVVLETDKVTVEVPAPSGGVLADIRAKQGESVKVGAVIAVLDSAGASVAKAPVASPPTPAPQVTAVSTAAVPVIQVRARGFRRDIGHGPLRRADPCQRGPVRI